MTDIEGMARELLAVAATFRATGGDALEALERAREAMGPDFAAAAQAAETELVPVLAPALRAAASKPVPQIRGGRTCQDTDLDEALLRILALTPGDARLADAAFGACAGPRVAGNLWLPGAMGSLPTGLTVLGPSGDPCLLGGGPS
jgi:hypothetical protein